MEQINEAADKRALRVKIDFKPFGEDRGWLEVIGEEFTIPGVTGHQFVVHNRVDCSNEYTATHVGTGFSMANADSPDFAIKLATKKWLSLHPEHLALCLIRGKNLTKVPKVAAPVAPHQESAE